MKRTLSILVALGTFGFVPAAGAQSVLIRDGDTIPGVGNVTGINNLAVNDSGSWILEIDTDNANSDEDIVLWKDGALLLQENDALPLPVGATLNTFDAVTLNDGGNSGYNFFLSGTSGGSDDSGVYFGTTLVIQESDFSTSGSFSPNTPYIGFFEVKLNGAGDLLVMASVDDALIPSTVDRALVRVNIDGAGNLISEIVVAKEGDTPAALGGDSITDMETGPHNFAYNANNEAAYVADVTTGFGGNAALFLGSTLIARRDGASPIGGRNWELLTSRPVSLNDSGDLFFRANLDGDTSDDEVLFHRTSAGVITTVAREGDTVVMPDGTFSIRDFGSSAPVLLSDNGDTLYFIDVDDADTSRDEALVYNGVVLVQEGKTFIAGDRVQSLGTGISDSYAMSSNGRYIVFDCKLEGNVDAAVLLDMEVPLIFCDASDDALSSCVCGGGDPGSGCDNAQATGGIRLDVVSQVVSPNGATLAGSGFSTMGSPTAIVIRSGALVTPVLFGDGLRCVDSAGLVRLAASTAVSGTSTHSFGNSAMAGPGTFYYQIWYRNTPSTFCDPFAAFNLSSGRSLTWP